MPDTDGPRTARASTDAPHSRGPPLGYPIEHDGERDDRHTRFDAEPELALGETVDDIDTQRAASDEARR